MDRNTSADDDASGPSRARRAGVVLLVSLLVITAIFGLVVVADLVDETTDPHTVDSGTINPDDGPAVTFNAEATSDRRHPITENGSVNLLPEILFDSNDGASVRYDGTSSGWTELSELGVSTEPLTVRPGDKQAVTLEGEFDTFDFGDVGVDDGSTDFAYSASGSSTATIHDLRNTTWYEAVDSSGNVVDVAQSDGSGSVSFQFDSGSNDIRVQESDIHVPEVLDPAPGDGEVVPSRDINLSATIGDADFPQDELEAEIYLNGNRVHSETLTENGTISTAVSLDEGGDQSWEVRLTDQYGSEITEQYTFSTPDTLFIRDELNPDDLIDEQSFNVTVDIYATENTIHEEVDDGSMNLTGVPVDEPLVITVRADGWQDRRILIRDITQQANIFLLNEDANGVEMTFELNDRTGEFPTQDSELYIQKSIEIPSENEDFAWRTVSGDFFASDGRFVTTLHYQDRYRVVIRNSEGDQRVLGSYIPTRDSVTTLDIGRIVWTPPEGEAVDFDASILDKESNDPKLLLRYNDTASVTSELGVTVRNRDNDGAVVLETTEMDISSYQETLPLTQEQAGADLVVEAYGVRDGEEDFETTIQLGQLGDVPVPFLGPWVTTLAQVLLVAIAGLVAGLVSGAAGIIVFAFATAFTWLGWLNIHPAALGVAGVIALLGALKSRRGGF